MSGAGILNNGTNRAQIKCNIVSSNEISRWSNSNQQAYNNCSGDGAGSNGNNNNNNNKNNSNNSNNNNNGSLAANSGLGTHQIAIQVICQDGTSLVLPVSSATTLNGLSLAPQNHQQLQAILGSGNVISNQQPRNVLPLVSVANIVAQQQSTLNESNGTTNTSSGLLGPNSGTTTNNATQTSGLAASSPTLAALLDAGSARTNNSGLSFNSNNSACDTNNSSSQSIVSSNLLRKLIGGNQTNMELKRGEISLQPGTQVGLTNNGALVTVCTATGSSLNGSAINLNNKTGPSTCAAGAEKRIKLENNLVEIGHGNDGIESVQTTFTLIEPHGLVVANGNDVSGKLSQADRQQLELAQTKVALLGDQLSGGNSSNTDSGSVGAATLKQQLGHNKAATSTSTTSTSTTTTTTTSSTSTSTSTISSDSNASKQCKMTSSTGNRQVDPTQPFRCEHCNSTFTRLGNFTRHKKIHTVPIKVRIVVIKPLFSIIFAC